MNIFSIKEKYEFEDWMCMLRIKQGMYSRIYLNIPRNTAGKWLNTNDDNKIWKRAKEKWQITHKEATVLSLTEQMHEHRIKLSWKLSKVVLLEGNQCIA